VNGYVPPYPANRLRLPTVLQHLASHTPNTIGKSTADRKAHPQDVDHRFSDSTGFGSGGVPSTSMGQERTDWANRSRRQTPDADPRQD